MTPGTPHDTSERDRPDQAAGARALMQAGRVSGWDLAIAFLRKAEARRPGHFAAAVRLLEAGRANVERGPAADDEK